jgi:hypothetical protein
MVRAGWWCVLAGLLAFGGGCTGHGGGSDAGDAVGDDFLADGKADTGGVVDGSAAAWGVLAVVNEATLAVLREDVGLSRRAAEAIDAYKLGDDVEAGTADDEKFTSLAELDAVPYVGPLAFAALLEYATENGYLEEPPIPLDDPFDPDACAGPAMTMEQAQALRASDPVLGTYEFAIRRRPCDTFGDGSCGAWTDLPPETMPWALYTHGVAQLGRHTNGFVAVDLNAGTCGQWEPGASYREYMIGARCTGVGQTITCPTYRYPCLPAENFSFDRYSKDVTAPLSGRLTEHCLQLRAEVKNIFDDGPSHEAAILVRF